MKSSEVAYKASQGVSRQRNPACFLMGYRCTTNRMWAFKQPQLWGAYLPDCAEGGPPQGRPRQLGWWGGLRLSLEVAVLQCILSADPPGRVQGYHPRQQLQRVCARLNLQHVKFGHRPVLTGQIVGHSWRQPLMACRDL